MDLSILGHLIQNSKQIKPEHIFNTHKDGISSLSNSALNPNIIAASCFDKTISLYDINSYKEISQLTGHSNGVWTCSFCPTQQNLLISGGSDKTIILWDTNSHQKREEIKEHRENIYNVSFSNNGKYFASCSKEQIFVYDLNNTSKPLDKLEIKKPKKEDGFIYCVNFIDNDNRIISGFVDGTLLVHKIGTELPDNHDLNNNTQDNFSAKIQSDYVEKYKEKEEYSESVYNIHRFHKNETRIGLSHSDGSIRIYDIKLNEMKVKLMDSFVYFTSPVSCSDTSNDDTNIVACGKDLSSQIWSLDTHKEIKYTLTGHKGIISSCLFIKNDKNDIACTGCYDNCVRVYKLN